MDPQALQRIASNPELSEKQKLGVATEQFEAVFLRNYLGEALKPVFEGYLNESGSGADIYRYMLSDSLASSMSQRSVFGMSDMLQKQLENPSASSSLQAINLNQEEKETN